MRIRGPRRVRVAIVGAGPGGLCMAMRLAAAGHRDFTVFERSEGYGGTWFHNRYPGAACDTKTPFYAFSFAPNPYWSRDYAEQPEILRYLEDCVEKAGVRQHIRLSTGIARAEWDERERLWRLETDAGERHEAEVLVSAVGMLNVPRTPEVPGAATFGGQQFHSARWPRGTDLRGRRVAVVGSGATSVQLVPAIAPQVEELVLFQRSPGWIVPKLDQEHDARSQRRLARFPALVRARRARLFWTNPYTIHTKQLVDGTSPLQQVSLDHIERLVPDSATRAAVTPDYPFACKRMLIGTEYLAALGRENVSLVTEGVAAVNASGVITTEGHEHAVDTIVWATGFKADEYLATFEVIGPGGRKLSQAWESGAEAYLGVATPGFPNLFMLYGPNTNAGSILFMIEAQVTHVIRLIRSLARRPGAAIEADPARTRRYNERMQTRLASSVWLHCTNYFRAPSGRITTQYPWSPARYWLRTRLTGPRAYRST